MQVQSLGQKDPLEKEMATHSNIFLGKLHGQRSLVGYIQRVTELDTTKQVGRMRGKKLPDQLADLKK